MGSAEIQAQMWGARARDWADAGESTSIDMFNTILDKTAVTGKTNLLDIGCGSGMFCQMASTRGAKVSGIDASEQLVNIARERVPLGDFRAGEMEDLPYPDATFDLVTGINISVCRKQSECTSPGKE
jgi:2-polyprenyl-3-methyl-5-hydroxy-6-metoxy-1,4-benzoquinol methylase